MSNNNKYTLILEGGGAKCAYQVGALIALTELGYQFDNIAGASFGAFNGALYLSGGIQKLMDFYTSLQAKDVFVDIDVTNLVENYTKSDEELLPDIIALTSQKSNVSDNKRILSKNWYNLLTKEIDESKIRWAGVDFTITALEVPNNPLVVAGLTFAISQKRIDFSSLYSRFDIKGRYYDLNNIPLGKLKDYVVASANYPTFDPLEINGKYYLDGGIFDNIPFKVMLEKGYQKLCIIRTNKDKLPEYITNNPNIIVLTPKADIGVAIKYTHDNIMNLIKLGYIETKEYLS